LVCTIDLKNHWMIKLDYVYEHIKPAKP
jgi:hypothetical protein